MFDLEALCREVEKHPLLYDPERRDLSKRNHTWRMIARAMRCPPEICKRHWRSVRDRFVREERLAGGLAMNDDDERANRWSLYRHLGFLKAYKARTRQKSVSSSEGRLRRRQMLEKSESEPTQSRHPQVAQPVQQIALQTIQVQPVGLQTIELVAQHYPSQEQKSVVEENPECSILHPDAITQSVLLSMVNVPPPDEVITPDQPPTTVSCDESPAYPNFPRHAEARLLTGRDGEGAAQRSFHMLEGAAPAASSGPTKSPAINGPPLITIKQEPGVETKECSNNPEGGGQGSSDSATAQSFQFTPVNTARELHRQRTAGSSDGHRAVAGRSRKRRRRDSQYDYCDDDDSNSKDGDGDKGSDENSTDDLLRELTTATERLSARVEHVTPCRLQHIDPEDSDTMYLLSLRERLRRFGPREKSLALVRIQEVLHKIEFGEVTS